MPFIGNTPDVNFTSFAKQDLTGVTGSPTAKRDFTLSHAVANANEIEVFVNNVRQEPEAYTASGTGLTMTGDVETSDDFYIIFLGKAIQTTVPPDGSVSTAKIADSAVSTAKIASSAVNLTSKVTGVLPVANGGTGSSSFTGSTMTLATTQSTTSGEDKDFMSIPSGTKRITIMFNGVGNANASALIRLGTSSGLTTSGYVSSSSWGSSQVTDTSGFIVYGTAGSSAVSGILTICHMGSNLFVASHAVRYNGSNSVFGGGHVQLGGTLDRLRAQGVSGGAFNSGSINVMYES